MKAFVDSTAGRATCLLKYFDKQRFVCQQADEQLSTFKYSVHTLGMAYTIALHFMIDGL
jgi:hypothetical protein